MFDHAWVRAAEQRAFASTLAAKTTKNLLATTLRLSSAEAGRRVRGAAVLSPRSTLLGAPLPPIRPVLAEAQRAGQVTPEQADLVLNTLTRLDHSGQVAVEDMARAEAALVGYVGVFAPRDLARVGQRITDALYPDGTLAEDTVQRDRASFTLTPVPGGMYRVAGELTAAVGAKVSAVLSPLAAPRPADATGADDRSPGLRWHDALDEAIGRVLASGGLPDTGGTPATVVTIDYHDLMTRTGLGTLSDGTLIPSREVLRLADEALVILTVLDAAGAVLEQGRARRIATETQTWALIARDGGCSFPSCTLPPDCCQRHHICDWIDDGPTDIDNLTLLCGYHHRRFSDQGWECRMNKDRLPERIPPEHVDQHRTPLRNTRIRGKSYFALA